MSIKKIRIKVRIILISNIIILTNNINKNKYFNENNKIKNNYNNFNNFNNNKNNRYKK